MCAKLEKGGSARTRRGPSVGLARLSDSMFSRLMDSVDNFSEGGKTNIMMGYGATMWMNNFLWSGLVIDDQTYQDVRLEADIFGLLADASLLPTIFGANSPFAPSLRTYVQGNKKGQKTEEEDDDELEAGLSLAKLSSLVPTLVTALA